MIFNFSYVRSISGCDICWLKVGAAHMQHARSCELLCSTACHIFILSVPSFAIFPSTFLFQFSPFFPHAIQVAETHGLCASLVGTSVPQPCPFEISCAHPPPACLRIHTFSHVAGFYTLVYTGFRLVLFSLHYTCRRRHGHRAPAGFHPVLSRLCGVSAGRDDVALETIQSFPLFALRRSLISHALGGSMPDSPSSRSRLHLRSSSCQCFSHSSCIFFMSIM